MIPNKDKIDVTEALPSFYLPFAGYVLQTRAIPDSRDGLKTGARFILYAQKKDKLTYDKKKRKGVATVNAGMRFNPHGDASIFGNAVRMSQPFSLRYPVIDVQGNNGSMIHGDDYSASRYIEMCSNRIADEMTSLLDKDTIDKWKLNYTQEEEYPTVLPTKFPFSLVNGSTGIGVAASSSIPCFNLRDVCDVLLKAVDDSDLPFEELYCPVDFPTGGIVINEEEIKESLKNGKGKSALIRAKIEYDEDKRELSIKELPYQVFTATIAKQLQEAIDEKKINGIESFFDGTDFNGVNIKIKLSKGANPERVCKQLYKSTSLQHHYSINMMMLDNGITPKLFSWKEMVYSYINHLENVMRKGFEFDYNKLNLRMEILNGYTIALARIEEIVETIKKAQNTAQASINLMNDFGLSERQAKAILELKLQRLVNMEVVKVEKEINDISAELNHLHNILTDEENFKNEIKKEIIRIKDTYGDDRRTKVINLNLTEDEDDPVEEKNLIIHVTNQGNFITSESTSLMIQKRNGKGSKIKLDKGEEIIQTISESNTEILMAFSNKGRVYQTNINNLPIGIKTTSAEFFNLEENEKICFVTPYSKVAQKNYFIFLTKNGFLKKTSTKEFRIKKNSKTGVNAIKLSEDDEICSIVLINGNEKIALATKDCHVVITSTEEITATGKIARGVMGIKLNKGDYAVSLSVIKPDDYYLVTVLASGLCKKTLLSEFTETKRNTKGTIVHKTREENDYLVACESVGNNDFTMAFVSSSGSIIRIKSDDIVERSRNTSGTFSMKLNDNTKIVSMTLIKE